MDESDRSSPRIVVVGPCASGKSTLVSALQGNGYDAYAVAQEHSAVRYLWRRRNPDVLIALDVPLDVVRQRRGPGWLESVYERQHERLASAYQAADLKIDTSSLDVEGVIALVTDWLREFE